MNYHESMLAQVANLSVSYKTDSAQLPDLPFEHHPDGRQSEWSSWRVNSTSHLSTDRLRGREMAAHYVKYLQDNPRAAGLNQLNSTAQSMAKQFGGDFDAVAGGFWLYLEEILAKHIPANLNPFKEAAEQQAQDDAPDDEE